MDLLPAQPKRSGTDILPTKPQVALSTIHQARVLPASTSSRPADDAAQANKPIPPAALPPCPPSPSLPQKPDPSTSGDPVPRGIAGLPPKPAAVPIKPAAPPPRKKAAASAFIPKAKQKVRISASAILAPFLTRLILENTAWGSLDDSVSLLFVNCVIVLSWDLRSCISYYVAVCKLHQSIDFLWSTERRGRFGSTRKYKCISTRATYKISDNKRTKQTLLCKIRTGP